MKAALLLLLIPAVALAEPASLVRSSELKREPAGAPWNVAVTRRSTKLKKI